MTLPPSAMRNVIVERGASSLYEPLLVRHLADIHFDLIGSTVFPEDLTEAHAPGDRGLSRVDAGDAVAGNELLGLGERPVHEEMFAIRHREPHRCRARQQTLRH